MSFLRNYKIAYQIYNFFKKDQLAHNLPLYKKHGLKKKYYSSISSEDFKGIKGEINKYDRVDSKTEMPDDPDFQKLDPKIQNSLINWSRDGYAVLENFLTAEQVNQINKEVDAMIDKKEANWRYRNKIMFAINHSKLLKSVATNPTIIAALELLLSRKVSVFQSINFLTGSQQRTHSDSIHMTTFPYGNLIAIWIALEDITPDCGPLHYYPGSHKLPYVMNADFGNIGTALKLGDKTYEAYENKIEEVVSQKGLEKKIFLAKKGDILIWHPNLLHGGEAVTDPTSTRKSMVLHYYADDCICFHEVTQRPTLK